MTDIFNNIYNNKNWGYANGETLSGGGSTIDVNKYRIKFLANFINKKNITHIYDICGDCNWQHKILDLVNNKNIKYFGFDISDVALNLAREKNKNRKNMEFSKTPINLSEYIFQFIENNDTSLIIIKEVIQHLPLELGMQMLKNIKKSGFKYIAITNHDKVQHNVSINYNTNIGGFYPNNMFLEPFNFVNPIDDVNDIIPSALSAGYGNLIIFDIQEQNI